MWSVKVKKVKFTLEPATKAQKYSFFNLGSFVENIVI
jgi:hypothetical protein